MSHYTKFNGSWNINGDAGSSMSVSASTVTINGNLVVAGNTTTINSINSSIRDRLIILNDGESGAGVTGVYAGMLVNRGSLDNVAVRWNESIPAWELTNNGIDYSTISTAATINFDVINDLTPQLGGNLDVLSRSIFSSNAQVLSFDSNLAVKNSNVAPNTIANYNVIYAQPPGSGGSGLFVTNTISPQQELVTKRKAIVFALIM